MQIQAAMFDFDGTLTEKGEFTPPQPLADALVDLSQKMPIGFCTGRQLESFGSRGLSELLKEVNEKERPRFLENLFVFAENGAIGYHFNLESDKFEQIYRVEWPEEFVERAKFQAMLDAAVKDYGHVLYNAHKVVVVMGTKFYHDEQGDIEMVYDLAGKIYDITVEVLKKINPHYEKFVHVGNSGIGVIVGPAQADKDSAIQKFGEILAEKKGLKFEKNYRDIVVVGDSAQEGGNDFYFLSGRYGKPYSVGENLPDNPDLNLIFDENGKRLLHSKGTLKLIKSLLLA